MNLAVFVRQPLCRHHVLKILLNLLLKISKSFYRFFVCEVGQFFQVDNGKLSVFFGVFELFQQLVDLLQFLERISIACGIDMCSRPVNSYSDARWST